MPIEMPLAAQRNESFWQMSSPPIFFEVHGEDAPGEGSGEGDLLARPALRGEDGHEEALPGEDALARAEQRPHEALRLVLPAAVAEDRLHLDAGGHVHEGTRLGHDALARVELDLDELQVLALDPVVDLVRARHGGRRVGGGHRGRGGGGKVRLEPRDVAQRRPALHARDEDERRGVGAAAADRVDHVLLVDGPDLLAADGHVPLGRRGHPGLLLQVRPGVTRRARGRRVDAGGGHALEAGDRGRVEGEAVRELREVDALPAGHRLVGADDGEGEGVELLLELRVGHPGHELAERPRGLELPQHEGLRADLAGLGQDPVALVGAELAVGPGGGDHEPHELEDRRGKPALGGGRGKGGARQRRRGRRPAGGRGARRHAPLRLLALPGLVEAPGDSGRGQERLRVDQSAAPQRARGAPRRLPPPAQGASHQPVQDAFRVQHKSLRAPDRSCESNPSPAGRRRA